VLSPTELTPEAAELHRDKVKRALRNKARLDAIERSGLIESALEIPPFNRGIRLAAKALRAPVAQINVLTDKQFVPIAVYAEGEPDAEQWGMRRQVGNSYCKYVVWSKEAFQVDDARENPLVRHSHATRELDIAAYLAVPIYAPAPVGGDALVVGTVCVIDHEPREWTADDVRSLSDFALGVSELIASRIRIRAQVQSVEQQTDRVLDAVGVAVLATDANGVTTFANPAALEILGYTAEQLTGHDQHSLIHHTRPDGSRYPETECPNYRARREKRSCHLINDTFWRSDGTPISVDSTMTPIFERGEVIGTVLTFTDVSERRAAEEGEHVARLAAEAANRAKTEMLAAMSHELRVPLAAIGERTERLESALVDVATAEQRDDLRGIQRSQQHLLGLIDNVVHFSTLEVQGRADR
jgi:PAS domain S-box-containing protein